MSKVEAYICDFADHLIDVKSAVGINPAEDMFDKLSSFPTIYNPAKTNVHYCTECYKKHVLVPASNLVNRNKDERGYELKLRELAFGLRSQTVHNHRLKNSLKKR